MRKRSILAGILIFFGLLMFFGGLYLLPLGTDIWLYFFVEVIAKGDWLLGAILANLTALGLIILGFLILRAEGVEVGLKKRGGPHGKKKPKGR